MVPERNKVDECFTQAHATATSADTKALIYALEGVARSIRDADDTQDNIREELVLALNESNVTMTEAINNLAASLPRNSKGLFDR